MVPRAEPSYDIGFHDTIIGGSLFWMNSTNSPSIADIEGRPGSGESLWSLLALLSKYHAHLERTSCTLLIFPRLTLPRLLTRLISPIGFSKNSSHDWPNTIDHDMRDS